MKRKNILIPSILIIMAALTILFSFGVVQPKLVKSTITTSGYSPVVGSLDDYTLVVYGVWPKVSSHYFGAALVDNKTGKIVKKTYYTKFTVKLMVPEYTFPLADFSQPFFKPIAITAIPEDEKFVLICAGYPGEETTTSLVYIFTFTIDTSKPGKLVLDDAKEIILDEGFGYLSIAHPSYLIYNEMLDELAFFYISDLSTLNCLKFDKTGNVLDKQTIFDNDSIYDSMPDYIEGNYLFGSSFGQLQITPEFSIASCTHLSGLPIENGYVLYYILRNEEQELTGAFASEIDSDGDCTENYYSGADYCTEPAAWKLHMGIFYKLIHIYASPLTSFTKWNDAKYYIHAYSIAEKFWKMQNTDENKKPIQGLVLSSLGHTKQYLYYPPLPSSIIVPYQVGFDICMSGDDGYSGIVYSEGELGKYPTSIIFKEFWSQCLKKAASTAFTPIYEATLVKDVPIEGTPGNYIYTDSPAPNVYHILWVEKNLQNPNISKVVLARVKTK